MLPQNQGSCLSRDIERIYAFLSRVLPAQTLHLLSDVIALNHLTKMLDDDLCRVLVDRLGVTDTITPQQYAEGYRICDHYAERAQQIFVGTIAQRERRILDQIYSDHPDPFTV